MEDNDYIDNIETIKTARIIIYQIIYIQKTAFILEMTYIQLITNTQKTIYTQKTIPQKESRESPQSLLPARKRKKLN